LSIEAMEAQTQRARVEVGVGPISLAVVGAHDGRAVFPRAPCGDVWVDVRVATPAQPEGARCTNARPSGRIAARPARPSTTIACDALVGD
jgi:hypothetical protein